MNVAAKVKRVLGNFRALSAAGVAALLFTAPAYAASLNGPSTSSAAVMPVAVDFVNGDDSNQVVVHGGIKADEFTVSRLTAPDRVVIDVLNHPQGKNKSFDTSDSRFVQAVRFGSHPEKSRIVLDLNSQESTSHEARLENGDLVVTIKSGNSPASASDARAEMKKNTYAAPSANVANSVSAESRNSWPRLTGLSIENADGNNSVIADMSKVSGYTLKQSAPSEYVLTLKGATLDETASTSLVSPQGTGDIRAARPVVQGGDVSIRIFTAPQVTLEAKDRGSKIIVASANIAKKADSRAQFAPEAASKKSGAAAAPAITNAGTGEEKVPVAPMIKSPTEVAAPGMEKASGAAANAGAGDDGDELSALLSETPKYNGRLISLDLQDTDIDNALRIIAEVSNLNIIASDAVTGKVTLRLIDVPWDQALDVILKTNNLDKVQEGNVIRIAPVEALKSERESLKQAQQAEDELEAMTVKYVRISYAKAAELKPLVETVLSERGSVAYDERTNQLIVKDINKGVKNVAQLIAKLDLRTPQVLLETQILEAQRNLLRDLGAELGFQFVRSPATGNATGYNFPNSIAIGGGLGGAVGGTAGPGGASAFPAAVSTDKGGAGINLLFGSADGSATIGAKITALESEGRVRIVSRPAVATTNNKQAIIKAVEKIRIKTPSGGTSVATGAGASASGGSGVATEVVEIGITLQVTPQASPDYFVLLDINAKSSTFGSRTVDGIPSEVERSANSTVLVSSGQTFALGGIYKITDQDNVDGVPFLKDIPFFGALFRRQKVDNRDEELVIFVTPRIIEGSFDDAAMKAGA